jgi:serine/threonine protein kinase
VYRAEDTKLGREVAIKVLPEEFTANQDRLARFEREARALAALNHPNIAGIYEVGEAETGLHYLVMELAEGEDLAARLSRGSIPADEALSLALQIARALEAAHEKGIVHRDLKPSNLMVSAEGQIKVLDFGLAKAWQNEAPAAGTDQTQSPTLTAQMTMAGVILGTAAYMSPEQARGQEADQRSDIWSFGAVLYEMLVGRGLFAESTMTDTLAAVLRADIEWDELPDETPTAVQRLLRRSLERDPKQRLHSVADARLELQEAASGAAAELDTAAVAASSPRAPGSGQRSGGRIGYSCRSCNLYPSRPTAAGGCHPAGPRADRGGRRGVAPGRQNATGDSFPGVTAPGWRLLSRERQARTRSGLARRRPTGLHRARRSRNPPPLDP